MNLKEGLLNGNKRAAARMITMFEDMDKEALEIIRDCYEYTGNAKLIGITGPPGAGKSTLTGKLTKHLRALDKKVGIIAVDPTSPFTGGAILGDRIRMSDLATDQGVFIRSVGTRGSLGGLAKSVYGAVKILDIFGMDYIFIETVGVGQSEIDIVKLADTVVVVMVPGLGDDIQMLKAGIMEIGDVFPVNKSDREGAERTYTEVNSILDQNNYNGYRPAVLNVIASEDKGIDLLLEAINKHWDYMESSGLLVEKKRQSAQSEILEIIKNQIAGLYSQNGKYHNDLDSVLEEVLSRKMDPYSAADLLIEKLSKDNI